MEKMEKKIEELNQAAWDRYVELQNQWTIPVTPEEIARARDGQFEIKLTPWKSVPKQWFCELRKADVLCLASAGGQQAPLLSAAGARVVVLDISANQLAQDSEIARRESLDIELIQGDMTDLSMFADKSFNLIFHPVANCFIPDVIPVWEESFRVLKKDGLLLAGFPNPVLYLFDATDPRKRVDLRVRFKIPYSDYEALSPQQREYYIQEGIPFEFGHTLEAQIGGQLSAGFKITGFYEDRHHKKDHPIYKYIPTFMATRAIKTGGSSL
jgi:SAM-dependent methyltransferase